MLARVTYGLVGAALIALVLGIFVMSENNTMLYISIALSILCIALVVFGAARRARYISPEGEEAEEPEVVSVDDGPMTEEVSSDEVLSAFEDTDEGGWDEEEEEEEDLADEDVEEVAPRRAPAKAKTPAKKTGPKKKPAAKRAAASGRTTTRTATRKVIVVPGRDRYHTADCRFVKGKDDTEEIAAATAKRRGYEPCSVCNPEA